MIVSSFTTVLFLIVVKYYLHIALQVFLQVRSAYEKLMKECSKQLISSERDIIYLYM